MAEITKKRKKRKVKPNDGSIFILISLFPTDEILFGGSTVHVARLKRERSKDF